MAPDDDGLLDPTEARRLARAVVRIVDDARYRVTGEGSDLVDRVTSHLGVALEEMPHVTLSYAGWEHASLPRGAEAYLAAHSPDAEWFGARGATGGMSQGLAHLLALAAQQGLYRLGAVAWTTVAVGPGSVTEAVDLGLVATRSPGGRAVVIGLRGPQALHGHETCQVEIFAATRDAAVDARDALAEHVRAHDVHRGAVLSFDVGDHRGNDLVTFLDRPRLDADDVVLPAGVLETIETHVVRAAEHTDALRAWGQHLKRGVLLHGPPGTGKTHTVRYLLSRLGDVTAAVLSGRALARGSTLAAAVTLVRRLQPAVLVLEDVDLVAEDRSSGPGANPLLFELLNRIDGLDPDADVAFILTTNRVDALERALADRPGRVDLAVEIGRPDADARERLLRLYAGSVALDLPDPSALIAATDGVTASFIREWVRRSVSAQLVEGARPRLDAAVLDALTEERQHLTGRLLGGPGASSGRSA